MVRPKKALGQHFLTDLNIAQKITESLQISHFPNANVLEVGAGTGVLTQFLHKNDQINYSIVEIDDESVAYLHEHYPHLSKHILHEDFLKLNLDKHFEHPLLIIGNFPYNISSQIYFKILEHTELIPQVVGMLQKEVAVRLASKPGKKDYGILSVLLQTYYHIEYLFTVGPHVFNPPPKVESAVIRITRNQRTTLPVEYAFFKRVIKTAFNQRRKTLRNSLKPIVQVNEDEHQFLSRRPETLSVDEFLELSVWLKTKLE